MAEQSRRQLVYLVVGEASGDALGADLVVALRELSLNVDCIGLAGPKMQALGMSSLFDIEAISVMGFAAVVARLPTIIDRIGRTARDIVERKPDIVVLIDSPDFTHRVAKKVRKKMPGIPIVKYICPSVWAWRSGRAKTMGRYIDHVLAILPFEPKLLAELGGPPATYIGHPMARRMADIQLPNRENPSAQKTLLLLPGSRRGEISLLLEDFRQTVEILVERGNDFRYLLPAVPKLEADLREKTARWKIQPEIVSGEEAKTGAFVAADAALATSGTVLLELALFKVPMVSIYRLDWLLRMFRHLISAWTAALPNLIADKVIVPERVEDMVRPHWLARSIEDLMRAGPARVLQLRGFDEVSSAMQMDAPSGVLAARKVLELIK